MFDLTLIFVPQQIKTKAVFFPINLLQKHML